MKKSLLIIGKVVLTAAVLGWVVHRLGSAKLEALWVNVCTASPWRLGLAFLLLLVPTTLGIVRWRMLLRVQGIHLTAYQATWIVATGQFFNAFLLGATGGDVFKAWYAANAAPDQKAVAVLSVAVDRLVGLVGLFVVASAVTLLNLPVLLEHPETKGLVYMVVGGLIAVILVLALATQRHRITAQPWWDRVWQRLPAKQVFGQLSESYRLYEKQPGTLIIALVLSFGVHLFCVLVAWLIGQALGIEQARLVHYLVYCPIINAIAAVPVTVSGLGVREGAFIFFFGLQGVSDSQSVALSLIYYATSLGLCLVCGLLFLLGKPRAWGFPTRESRPGTPLK